MARPTPLTTTDDTPRTSGGEDWLAVVAASRPGPEQEILRRAAALASRAHAGQQRASGEPYVQHSLAVARILADLGLDHETLAAAILHDVGEGTGIALD